jgi:hypothetical protein
MAAGGGRQFKNSAATLSRMKTAGKVKTPAIPVGDVPAERRSRCKKEAHTWAGDACVRCPATREPEPAPDR